MNNTTDLWFASFLMMKGHEVSDFTLKSKGKGIFGFNISDEDWKQLKLEFGTSDISRVKYHQERLKDLLY